MEEVNFKFNEEINLNLYRIGKSFNPTGTTNVLMDSVVKYCTENKFLHKKVLDLGCGIGVSGIIASLTNVSKAPIYLSDLSHDGVQSAQKNCAKYTIESVIKEGSIYEPWVNEKFDIIINDISGIAESVAKLSPWFKGVPCFSGDDGTFLVNQVIELAPNHLNKNGLLFFPLLSLSNIDRSLNLAKKVFENVHNDCQSNPKLNIFYWKIHL